MASTWTLRIPGWHPAPLNKLLNKHWGGRDRAKKADQEQISKACLLGGVPKATTKRRVLLLLVLDKGQRGCDPDAYHKSLMDALVACGALVNDSRHWVECPPPRFARGEVKEAIITLEDVA